MERWDVRNVGISESSSIDSCKSPTGTQQRSAGAPEIHGVVRCYNKKVCFIEEFLVEIVR